jgi:hypothetical protein
VATTRGVRLQIDDGERVVGLDAAGIGADNLRAEVTRAIDSSEPRRRWRAGRSRWSAPRSSDQPRRRHRQIDQRHGVRQRLGRYDLRAATRTCLPSLAETAIWAEPCSANKAKSRGRGADQKAVSDGHRSFPEADYV